MTTASDDPATAAPVAGLRVGVAEVDITPPVGTALCGDLAPRESVGIEDPLHVKAIVLEAGGQQLAYVILDLIWLTRLDGDAAVALAAERTGISPTNIVWAASHTHTGPYTTRDGDHPGMHVDGDWLNGIPAKFAQAVEQAQLSLRPARMSRLRSFHYGLAHNRRVMFKNGRAINTWNLAQADDDIQSVGLAGPTDPEIAMLAFDDDDGELFAVLFHFTLHTNTNFGNHFSADYPGVVASRLRERFGPQVSTLFLPGACADLNGNGRSYRQVGDELAAVMIKTLETREPRQTAPPLAAVKRDVMAGYRDFSGNEEERIASSGWSAGRNQDVFRYQAKAMRESGEEGVHTVLQAWRIGDIGFAYPESCSLNGGSRSNKRALFPGRFQWN